MKVRNRLIGYLPRQVARDHLNYQSGMLYSNRAVSVIKKHLAKLAHEAHVGKRYRQLKIGRYEVRLPHAVITQDDALFAVYKGIKQESSTRKKRRGVVPWEFILGEGRFGVVKLALDLNAKEWIALKVITSAEDNTKARVQHELKGLHRSGQAITSDHGQATISLEHDAKPKFGRSAHKYFLPCKLAKGDELFQIMHSSIKMPPVFWIELIIKMFQSVKQMHANRILHRDLKLENMKYHFNTGEFSIVDFGFAVDMNEAGEYIDKHAPGTYDYLAPELKNLSDRYVFNEGTEVYALALVASILLDLSINKINLDAPCRYLFTLIEKENLEEVCSDRLPEEEKLRVEVYDFFARILAESEGNGTVPVRPSVDEAITFFKQLATKLSVKDKTMKIGLLNVSEYMAIKHGTVAVSKLMCLKSLKAFNYVWLVDDVKDHEDPLYYEKIMQELLSENIIVKNQVVHEDDVERLLKGESINLADDDSVQRYNFTVLGLNLDGQSIDLTEKKGDAYQRDVIQALYESIIAKLDQELALLRDNCNITLVNGEYACADENARLQAVNLDNIIDLLVIEAESSEIRSYASLIQRLNDLKQLLENTSSKFATAWMRLFKTEATAIHFVDKLLNEVSVAQQAQHVHNAGPGNKQ